MKAFLVIAFGLSWGCWIPAALSEEGLFSTWARWLVYAGALGPGVAGIALIYISQDEKARHDYWVRVTDFSRIRLRWLIPILLLYPIATLLALLFDTIVTGIAPHLQTASRLLAKPSSIAVFVIWILLFGPLSEELGWRGYALDQLQRNRSALTSSLILGLIWAVWHLPLFLSKVRTSTIWDSFRNHSGPTASRLLRCRFYLRGSTTITRAASCRRYCSTLL